MEIPNNMRKLSQFFSVNGTPIYEPDYDVTIMHESLADSESGRTRDGIMHINWIRRDMRKFEIKYSALTNEEYDKMQSLLQGKIFTWGYYHNNVPMTMQAYCSNHTYTTQYVDPTTKRGIYTNLKFSIIEV